MATPLRRALSLTVGWLADRRVPTPLRAPLYRTYARFTGADLGETRPPLEAYASLGAFFVRRLVEGARTFPEPAAQLPSPVDGTIQAIDRIAEGTLLQAKGRTYPLADLLGDASAAQALEGGCAWTIYLSPRDYHRIHAPDDARLRHVRWLAGNRYSVRPAVLERRARVLCDNERAVLELERAGVSSYLVLVGALNVGRIRVLGVPSGRSGPLEPARDFGRGDELARFEMGSTIVLLAPAGDARPVEGLGPGSRVRMGQPIGTRDA